jgi:Flp pilus assembly protein TadD
VVGSARSELAVAAAREAVKLAPYEPLALESLCDAALAAGQFVEARRAAEELLRVAPNREQSYDSMARVCLREGHCNEATQYARHGLALDPRSSNVHSI